MSQEIRIVSSVRAARNALAMSQQELAELGGISLVALARLESVASNPRLSTITKLKEALEKRGVKIIDNVPDGGFTMTVSKEALDNSALYFMQGFHADKVEKEDSK